MLHIIKGEKYDTVHPYVHHGRTCDPRSTVRTLERFSLQGQRAYDTYQHRGQWTSPLLIASTAHITTMPTKVRNEGPTPILTTAHSRQSKIGGPNLNRCRYASQEAPLWHLSTAATASTSLGPYSLTDVSHRKTYRRIEDDLSRRSHDGTQNATQDGLV